MLEDYVDVWYFVERVNILLLQYLRMSFQTPWHNNIITWCVFLYSVLIWVSCVTVNIALGKTAYQSSVTADGSASLAVDGNTNPDYFNAGSCTHTHTELNPWWMVDLQDTVTITRVEITNRMTWGEWNGEKLKNLSTEQHNSCTKVEIICGDNMH